MQPHIKWNAFERSRLGWWESWVLRSGSSSPSSTNSGFVSVPETKSYRILDWSWAAAVSRSFHDCTVYLYTEMWYVSAVLLRCYRAVALFLWCFILALRHVCEGRKLFGKMSIQTFYLHGLKNISRFTEFMAAFPPPCRCSSPPPPTAF